MNLKGASSIDTSKFRKKVGLGSIRLSVDKWRNVVKNDVIKNIVHDELVKKVNATDSIK